MGLFHDTLRDVRKAAKKNDIKKMEKICDNHYNKSSVIDEKIDSLKNAMILYEHQLIQVNSKIKGYISGKAEINNHLNSRDLNGHIDFLEEKLKNAREMAKEILKELEDE